MKNDDVFGATLSAFGTRAKAKLSNRAVVGAPEDQLRAPLEALTRDLAALAGMPDGAVDMVGESTLSHLLTRPDYAVVVWEPLLGSLK